MNKKNILIVIGIVCSFIFLYFTYTTFFANSKTDSSYRTYANTTYNFSITYPKDLIPGESNFKYHPNTERIIVFSKIADTSYDPETYPPLQVEISSGPLSTDNVKVLGTVTLSNGIKATKQEVTIDEGPTLPQIQFQHKGKTFTLSGSDNPSEIDIFNKAIASLTIR